MTTSDMIRELCEKKNISLAELARRIGQSPQNFNKKLKRGTVSFEEMMEIAKALNVKFEQAFVLPDGQKINGFKSVYIEIGIILENILVREETICWINKQRTKKQNLEK